MENRTKITNKDKQLLLKELCARLPYGVKVQVYDNRYLPTTLTAIDIKKKKCIFNFDVPVENCLPYLRPMSSMTEEEKKEFQACHCVYGLHPDFQPMMCNLANELNMFDWLNAHHFDFRNLIERGLAIEATERIYNNQK